MKGGEPQIESKQNFIQRLIDNPEPQGHELQFQTNYLVCTKCGMRTLRNSAREKIEQLHQSQCWSGKWEPPATWTGNPTHQMQRRGNKIWCEICKACAIPSAKDWKASKQLQRPCAKADERRQLPLVFQAKRAAEHLI